MTVMKLLGPVAGLIKVRIFTKRATPLAGQALSSKIVLNFLRTYLHTKCGTAIFWDDFWAIFGVIFSWFL
jgi:hypothetical protein